MNRFIIAEPQLCIGCRTCEIACALAHPVGLGAEALSPLNFRPRLTVVKNARVSTPVLCRHCEDAPCLHACPNGAIIFSQDSVQVLQELCVGCKTCMLACPYGAIEVVALPEAANADFWSARTVRAQALKCDLCIDHPGGPACIASCPTDALHMVDQQVMDVSIKTRREQAAREIPLGQF
jgi:electron transport protein HydN